MKLLRHHKLEPKQEPKQKSPLQKNQEKLKQQEEDVLSAFECTPLAYIADKMVPLMVP